jgi:hypothetical protein
VRKRIIFHRKSFYAHIRENFAHIKLKENLHLQASQQREKSITRKSSVIKKKEKIGGENNFHNLIMKLIQIDLPECTRYFRICEHKKKFNLNVRHDA